MTTILKYKDVKFTINKEDEGYSYSLIELGIDNGYYSTFKEAIKGMEKSVNTMKSN